MPRLLCLILLLVPIRTVVAQIDSEVVQLDAFWAELGRSVMEGDLDGLRAVYHPDALDYDWEGDSYEIKLMSSSLDEQIDFHKGTKNGERRIELEWRFSSRIHNSHAAHEVGVARFTQTPRDSVSTSYYAHVEEYLVKKGKWVSLVSNVRWNATIEEWDDLRPGN